MTIQKRGVLFFIAVVLTLLTLILLMGYRLRLQQRLTEAEKERYESYRLAVQLKGTADQLSQMIRTYTLTANPHYREYYRHILDIRSGKEPRPEGYDLLFWDLIDFTHEYTPPKEGKKIPFSTLLKEAKINEQEIAKLRQAQAYANSLAGIEREALHLMDLASIDDDLSIANRLAAFLEEQVDQPHILGRWGGEEFLILVKNLSYEEASRLAERLRARLETLDLPFERRHLSASFGVTPLRPDRELEESFACADWALYRVEVEECKG